MASMRYFVILLFLCLVACGPSKVIHYSDPDGHSSAYRTYAVYTNGKVASQSILEDLIEKEMDTRGYQKSSIAPDLFVIFEMASSSRTETNTGNYAPYPRSFYTPTIATSQNIHERYLIITIKDKNKKLIWQGSQKLRKQKSKETEEDVLKESVTLIFNTYLSQAAA